MDVGFVPEPEQKLVAQKILGGVAFGDPRVFRMLALTVRTGDASPTTKAISMSDPSSFVR